ncbi:MAG: glycosyltransferase WbuB [Chloroflexi bacterium]|nr:glycosyltransferase WbuB [Chloroflexota bacterium]
MAYSLHILLIHQAFISLDEAGGTRHAEFARHLVENGHRVTIIASPVSYLTGQPRPADTQLPGLTILRARTTRALHRSFLHRLLNFFVFTLSSFWIGLRVKNVDLVWGTSPPIFQAAAAWALARLKRVPFLLEIRDLWPAFAVAVGILRNPVIIRLSEWLECFLYRRADQLLINSPGFRPHLEARGAHNISVVPNGSDAAMFDPAAKGLTFRRAHHLDEKFVVLYAGAHGMSNDLGIVLEAASQLRQDPAIHLVLLGDGKDKLALQQRAAELMLDNITFVPPIPKSGMPDALAAADACLAILKPLELYATVYPNKVFDYMAAGRPVLLAIDGVIRTVVEEAGAGIFVPPGDPAALAAAIRGLAADPKSARKMGLAGRAHLLAHFNRPEIAAQMQALIERTARPKKQIPNL